MDSQFFKADDPADTILKPLDLTGFVVVVGGAEDALEAAAKAGASQVFKELDIGSDDMFSVVDQAAKEFALSRAAELVGMRRTKEGKLIQNPNAEWSISDSTREMIKGAVNQAIKEGWSTQQLKGAIRGGYTFSSQRALMISRTEIQRAHGLGTARAIKTSGAANRKTWTLGSEHDVAVPEGDICDDNADQGPISLDESFVSGDEAEPAHPNDACSVIYEWVDEEDESDEEKLLKARRVLPLAEALEIGKLGALLKGE